MSYRFSMDCPLPKLDFDVITLGHGSGGILTHRLLDKLIFEALRNPILEQEHDGAFFQLPGELAFTTDSFVVHPVFFPGGNIGELAVNGTVNDLAMCGAIPRYLSLGLILEEGLPVAELWEILQAIKHACAEAHVQVVTGDTKVVDKGKGDKIFINTTGVGTVHPKARIHSSHIRSGDQILVSGPIAAHGMAILSVREGLSFESPILSDTQSVNHLVVRLLDAFGDKIRFLRDPTRGGVATVLNEISQKSGAGIRLQERDLPVGEAVEGACELLGLDPLYVANEGIFIAVVAPDIADTALAMMQGDPKGQGAARIGEVVDTHPGQVVIKSLIGGSRVVHMLPGEQLPRIC
ncbi:MAG: hydrogenase expression/formation protein HypE [Lewinellaceae bacterium]|nr:hydrogenase expression/formation protein HypE [Lewinellaceae bacterium]